MSHSRFSNLGLARWLKADGVADQAVQQCQKIAPAVEPFVEGTVLAAGLPGELEHLVPSAVVRCQVAWDSVDRGELRLVARFSVTNSMKRVRATRVANTNEASQAIRANGRPGSKLALFKLAMASRVQLQTVERFTPNGRPALLEGSAATVGTWSGGTAASSAWMFVRRAGIVQLHVAGQRLSRFGLARDSHQLVMHQPSAIEAGAQVANERQQRLPAQFVADQVNGQAPGALRRLVAIEHGAGARRRPIASALASKQGMHAASRKAMLSAIAVREQESIPPAHHSELCSAMLFSALADEELRHRQPRLELGSVHRYGGLRRLESRRRGDRKAEKVSLLSYATNQANARAEYTIRVPQRDAVKNRLHGVGNPTTMGYPLPLSRQGAVADGAVGLPAGDPAAREFLGLPMHAFLEDATQKRITSVLLACFAHIAIRL